MTNSNFPLVSIGLPVFNGEKFLRQTLHSLLAQEFTDFELIISDNASTDSTGEICKEYAAADARIRYIRQSQNIGARSNFNFVLQQAQGEYFMWAAADDQWAPSFVPALLASLEGNPGAIGAFCPYQLVEDETGVSLVGTWNCNYQSARAFTRLMKLTWQYSDACIYGLFHRAYLKDVQFKPWRWINAATPYNLVYPVLYLLLSKGNFLYVGKEPLWYKRVSISRWHSTPFKGSPVFAYFAHVIRKLNLLVRSLNYIYRGSKSVALAFSMIPFLFVRFCYDCVTPMYAAIAIWASGRKISQVSPHEIWQLGVR
jgi:glycosyltransferase involved in cell wall biosynthesis